MTAFLSALLLGLFLARGLSSPIIRLKEAAMALGRADLEVSCAVSFKDGCLG